MARFLRIRVTPRVYALVRVAAQEALAIFEERRKEKQESGAED